jgi:hypothetical protein
MDELNNMVQEDTKDVVDNVALDTGNNPVGAFLVGIGAIALLVAMPAAYGVKKLIDKIKNNKKNQEDNVETTAEVEDVECEDEVE